MTKEQTSDAFIIITRLGAKIMAVSCFRRSKKRFFREFFLKGKETTELYQFSGIFEHTFEEYKKKFSFIKS